LHDAIEAAVGGKAATEIYEGERRFKRGAFPGSFGTASTTSTTS
jgi:hypothetical protein